MTTENMASASTQGFRVYVVDDEPVMLTLTDTILEDEGCIVEGFASGPSCLARAAEQAPDMFLLDVRLGGMDGYALCRALKSCPDTADIPVTFVSGLDSIEARLAGYEAGGEDFIVKPFEPSELVHKVQIAQRIRSGKQQLHEMAGYAQRTAFSAMASMGELGIVLDFLRRSFACNDSQSLAQTILAALEQYGLQGAVQIRIGQQEDNLSAAGSNLPLEVAILNHMRNQGRIFEFGSRSVFNHGGITVLIKNMPQDDAERCGRLRDNLAILTEGADARRHAIEADSANRRTRSGIGEALTEVQQALDVLREQHQREQFHRTQLMIDIQEGMTKFFVSLGLSEQQENLMFDFIRQQFEHLQDGMEDRQQVSAKLEQLANKLNCLTD
jgi:CheY-like chemotaxis protein